MALKTCFLLALLGLPASTRDQAPPIMKLFDPDAFDLGEWTQRLFGPGRPYTYAIEISAGVHSVLKVTCTPDSWWRGGNSYSCSLTIDAVNFLRAFKVYAAKDVNGDGIIEPTEWTLVACASIAEVDGKTVAKVPTCHIGRGADAYRLVREYWNDSPFYDQWGSGSLEYQDP